MGHIKTPEHAVSQQEEPLDLSYHAIQKFVRQEKAKETYQFPLQSYQYSKHSWNRWPPGLQIQVQSSLLSPQKVPLHQAFEVISPSSSDGKPQGDADILHQDHTRPPALPSICKSIEVTFTSKQHCGMVWYSTYDCIQPLPFPQRYFKPAPDCRDFHNRFYKTGVKQVCLSGKLTQEHKHELDCMPALTKSR